MIACIVEPLYMLVAIRMLQLSHMWVNIRAVD